MSHDENVNLERLPFPKAREHWLAAKRMDEKKAVDLACRLMPLYPDRPFFSIQALDLAATTGDELRVARFVLDLAKREISVQLQPVFAAANILLASPEVTSSERAEAINLRDNLIESSAHRHLFRAQLAKRERDLDTALTEVSTHLELFPSHVSALVLRAATVMQTGRWGRYCNEILALASIKGNDRSTKMLELFQRFRAVQGLSSSSPDEIIMHQEVLETPGAVYEHAIKHAPPPDMAARHGVVLLTGSLAGGGAERIVATMLQQFRKMEPDESPHLWLFSKTNGGAGDALFYLPLTGLREDELHVIDPVQQPDEPFCWLPPFYAQRAQSIYDDLIRVRPRVLYITLDEAIIAGGIAAIMAGVPEIVLHCHNMSPPNLHGDDRLSFGWDRAFRTLLARPNVRYINVARVAVDDYLGWCRMDPADCHATVIHNGVDFSTIDEVHDDDLPRDIRRELGIPLRSPVVGAALRFTEVKQPMVWLDAARRIREAVPKAHFILYGDGALLEAAREYAEKLGLGDCVHFPGRVSDLAHRLPVFDILMLSSRSEGFPNVLIEAQAAGVVPVAFDVGGCRETMVPGRTGLIVSDKTADTLADEVAGLLTNRRLLLKMKRAGMGFVREVFSLDQMVAALHQLVYVRRPFSGTQANSANIRLGHPKAGRKGRQ